MKTNKTLKTTVLNILSYACIMIPVIITLACIVLPGLLIDLGCKELIGKIGPWIIVLCVVSLMILFPIGIWIGDKLIDKKNEIENNIK